MVDSPKWLGGLTMTKDGYGYCMEIRSEITSRSAGIKVSMERIRKVLARLKDAILLD